MRRHLNPILLLVCGVFLPGCMGGFPVAVSSDKPASVPSIDPPATREFDFNAADPADPVLKRNMGELDYELMGQIIAETPRGSQVRVCLSDQCYTGTLVKGTAEGVDLVNCICKEAVAGGPNGIKQCKTSHIPMLSFKTASMTSFSVFSPPSANYVIPDISQDSSGATVVEIVYRDGSRQPYGKSPVPAKPNERIDSVAQ